MNWITTNIRFPEELYMELKMEAAVQRKSFAELVRERVAVKKDLKKESVEIFMGKMDKFARKMAKKYKGKDFSKGLIEMRYEQ